VTPLAVLAAATITLWHAYQADERAALERAIAAVNARAGDVEIAPLAIPFGAFASKLETTIPYGHGPDLFLAAHDNLGKWAKAGLVAPLGPAEGGGDALARAFEEGGARYAVPVGFKALLLFWNRALLPEGPPADARELPALARRLRPRGAFALAYDTSSFFFHAPFFFALGGRVFEGDRVAVFDPAGARSFAYVRDLARAGVMPGEADSRLAGELFNAGRAAIVLSGPWFAGDVRLAPDAWDVAPLFAVEGAPAGSFVSAEGIYAAGRPNAAREALLVRTAEALATALAAERGKDRLAARLEAAERPALAHGLATPARPEMALVWEPAGGLLRDLLAREEPLDAALDRARHALAIAAKPAPPATAPGPYVLLASLALLALAARAVRRAADPRFRAAVRRARHAYAFALPAVLAMLALVVAPFFAGALISLFAYEGRHDFRFVGLANFRAILFSQDYAPTDPLSFYYTLAVTVLWTASNVALHAVIGVGLALLLRRPWVALRSVYRVVLVLPWAIPSYITALAWRGLFDREMGALNAILRALGAEPVSWFARFSTAFAANLATNVWLGFPFMLVVTLGALQAIPEELEEVAALEGATRLQRLRLVTLPAIRPALVPAVILGSVWTFNMFNVIYLVSGGEPAGKTEILISQVYRWAFQRNYQYGYAAAYAVLIFAILFFYSRLFERREEAPA
jgi:arabinogalactan oligomer/maltooligosaccharide transport system permease protein